MLIKNCEVCGKSFVARHPSQVTCNSECRVEYKRIRDRDYQARIRRTNAQNKPTNAQIKQTNEQNKITVDLKLYEILDIMYEYGITIREYINERDLYATLYLKSKR